MPSSLRLAAEAMNAAIVAIADGAGALLPILWYIRRGFQCFHAEPKQVANLCTFAQPGGWVVVGFKNYTLLFGPLIRTYKK